MLGEKVLGDPHTLDLGGGRSREGDGGGCRGPETEIEVKVGRQGDREAGPVGPWWGTHTDTHTCTQARTWTKARTQALGTHKKPGPAPQPPRSLPARSPAWTGPGFGAGGRGRDFQGSGSLSDKGTPAGETGQHLGIQSPHTLCQGLPPSPCPRDSETGPSSSTCLWTQAPLTSSAPTRSAPPARRSGPPGPR